MCSSSRDDAFEAASILFDDSFSFFVFYFDNNVDRSLA